MAILNSTASKQNQSGIALAISLIFLLLMTIIGVSAMSTTALQEKMAGNLKDKHWSFNAAESAIMEGERYLCIDIPGRIQNIDPANDTDGLYLSSNTGMPVWQTVDWSTPGGDYFKHPGWDADSFGLTKLAEAPKYIIEEVQEVSDSGLGRGGGISDAGKSKMLYRITARGVGGTPNAVTIVQSTFAKQ